MATIKRLFSEEKKFIITFELADGRKYYVGEGYIFLSIKDNLSIDVLEKCAKQYKERGAKVVTTRIWDEFSTWNEKKNGSHIVHSNYYSLEYVKKHLTYIVNGKTHLNLI